MTDPIRIIEGNAEPYAPFWGIVDAADSPSGDPEINFEGSISEHSWFEDDITPKKFKADLYRVGKNGPVTIRVNSGGGDVFAAAMIRATLASYPGKKTIQVDGIAASAAVAIVMSGDEVRIMDTGQMMIHEGEFRVMYARLNVATLERLAAELRVTNASLRDVYAAQTGISPKEIERMMAATTWMTANDAVKLGFADKVVSGGKARGSAALMQSLSLYSNVPAAVLALAQPEAPTEQPETPTEPEAEAPAPEVNPATPETTTPEGAAPEAVELAKRKERLAKLAR